MDSSEQAFGAGTAGTGPGIPGAPPQYWTADCAGRRPSLEYYFHRGGLRKITFRYLDGSRTVLVFVGHLVCLSLVNCVGDGWSVGPES